MKRAKGAVLWPSKANASPGLSLYGLKPPNACSESVVARSIEWLLTGGGGGGVAGIGEDGQES
jgi:hypothetical protein